MWAEAVSPCVCRMPNQNVFDKRDLPVQFKHPMILWVYSTFSKMALTHEMAFVTDSFRLSPHPQGRCFKSPHNASAHPPKDTCKLNHPPPPRWAVDLRHLVICVYVSCIFSQNSEMFMYRKHQSRIFSSTDFESRVNK